MVEALVQFQNRICRKALRFFEDADQVSFEDFLQFVNHRIGTDLHESFVEIFYKHFLVVRADKKEQKKLENFRP